MLFLLNVVLYFCSAIPTIKFKGPNIKRCDTDANFKCIFLNETHISIQISRDCSLM